LLNPVGTHSKYLCDLTIRLLFSLEVSMLNEGRWLNNFNFDPLLFSAVISCDVIALCCFVSNGLIADRFRARLQSINFIATPNLSSMLVYVHKVLYASTRMQIASFTLLTCRCVATLFIEHRIGRYT
jgi:hypothetical protein